MRDTAVRIHQGEWGNSETTEKRFSGLSNENKGMIKSRLGFIYFVVLVSSLLVLFTR